MYGTEPKKKHLERFVVQGAFFCPENLFPGAVDQTLHGFTKNSYRDKISQEGNFALTAHQTGGTQKFGHKLIPDDRASSGESVIIVESAVIVDVAGNDVGQHSGV